MKRCQRGTPPPRKELRETPVRLCNEISHLVHARMRRESDVEGVLSQHGARLLLGYLAVEDGQSQLELVKKTHLRPPTVSVILAKMEEEGIVVRRADERDRRVTRAYLTDFGRKTDAHTIARIQKTDEVAMADLSEEEKSTLMALLSKMRSNLLSDAARHEASERREQQEENEEQA